MNFFYKIESKYYPCLKKYQTLTKPMDIKKNQIRRLQQ